MKIAIIGDIHLGCSDYTDKRISDFSKKFVEAIRLAVAHEGEVLVLLGDIFDSSAYRRSVDSFASAVHEIANSLLILKSKKIPIVAILGNHEFGRGREGGELRILSDLGFVHVLNDGMIELNGLKFYGISWKSDIAEFKNVLGEFEKDSRDSFLLIHQFVLGSNSIPNFVAEVNKDDLKTWRKVFVGHHHVHESFDNICIPGSLEVHNVLEMAKEVKKGFVIFDTESGSEDFVQLPSSRPIRYIKILVNKMSSSQAENALRKWITESAEPHALLVAELSGKLASGRSSDINVRDCKSEGLRGGCLDVDIMNNIDDPVRTASDIRAVMKTEDFFKTWFKSDSKKALLYLEKFQELGDDFGSEIRDRLVDSLS